MDTTRRVCILARVREYESTRVREYAYEGIHTDALSPSQQAGRNTYYSTSSYMLVYLSIWRNAASIRQPPAFMMFPCHVVTAYRIATSTDLRILSIE